MSKHNTRTLIVVRYDRDIASSDLISNEFLCTVILIVDLIMILPLNFRYDWYQTDSDVCISILVKNRKQVEISYSQDSVSDCIP